MSELSAQAEQRLPKGKFGLPGKRKYPIPDVAHARNALARAAQFASPAEKAEIQDKVRRLYPRIKVNRER